MIFALHVTAIAAYLAAWAVHFSDFRIREKGPRRGRALVAVALGVGAQGGALVLYVLRYDAVPLVGLGPASSALALVIAAIALAAAVSTEARAAVLFLLPWALFLLAEAVIVGVEPAVRQTSFRGPWFVAHVSVVFVGYGALLLASAAALMYLLQFRALKRKEFGSVFRFFPSLDALDRLNRLGLLVGFPALTAGLVLGWSWTLTYGQRGLALEDPEVIFGIVTWVAYLAAIVARVFPGWKGERAADASTAAFVITLVVFLVLRFTAAPSGFFL